MSKPNITKRNDRQDLHNIVLSDDTKRNDYLHNTIESFRIWQLSPTWNANLPSSKNKPPRTSNSLLSSVKQCFGRGNIPQEGQDRILDIDIRVEAAVILKMIYLIITRKLPPIGNDEDSQNFWLWNILSYLCDENRTLSLGFREESHHCVTPFLKFNDQFVCNIVEKETSRESYLAVDELDDAGKLIQRYRRDIRGKAYSSIKLNENLFVTSGVIEYGGEGHHFRANFLMTINPNTGTESRYLIADETSKEVVENLVRLNNNQIISWKKNSQKMFLWNFSENPDDPFNTLNAVLNGQQQAKPDIELTMATAHDNSIIRLAHRFFYHLIWYNRLKIKSIVRLTDSKFAIVCSYEIIIAEMDNRSKYIEHYQRLKSERPIKLLIGLDENMIASTSRRDPLSSARSETITVWDLNSGKCRTLRGHTGRISTLFKLNDTTIVSGGSDHTLRVWDLKNKTSRVLTGHKGTIGSVKKVNDNMIISQSYDYTLRVWDLNKDTSCVLDRALSVFDDALPVDDVIITSKIVEAGVYKNRQLLMTHKVNRQSVFCLNTD